MFKKRLMLGFTSIVMALSMFASAAPVAAGTMPSDYCLKPYGSNHGWPVGQGETIWNACSGHVGAWMFQLNGQGDPIGHQHPKSYKQLVAWRANRNNPAGTFWFDAYVIPSGFCNGGVALHLPTGVRPSAPCGSGTYRLDIRGHTYYGSWSHLMYIRHCKFGDYEASAYKKPGCGC